MNVVQRAARCSPDLPTVLAGLRDDHAVVGSGVVLRDDELGDLVTVDVLEGREPAAQPRLPLLRIDRVPMQGSAGPSAEHLDRLPECGQEIREAIPVHVPDSYESS